MEEFLNFAHGLADRTQSLVRDGWLGDLEVFYKSDGSSLTAVDLAVEEVWRTEIRSAFPDHSILGEEFGSDTGSSAYAWVLDPIDGTRQFGTGLLNFASLISLCKDGEPVIGMIDLPLAGARFSAMHGAGCYFNGRRIRTSGRADLSSAVIGLCNHDSFLGGDISVYESLRGSGRVRSFDGGSPAYGSLARGLIDVCINSHDLNAHDICALCPIVQEAGGVITDWNGGALTIDSVGGIVASASRDLHNVVMEKVLTPLHPTR